MKLDRIKFAKLVGWLSYRFNIEINEYDDLSMLDHLCDVNVEPVATQYIEARKVNELLDQMNIEEESCSLEGLQRLKGEDC